MNARYWATKTLGLTLPAQGNGRSLSDAIATQQPGWPTQDSALIKEICFGVCRWKTRLECILRQFLSKPLKVKDQDIHLLLLIGLYQLYFLRTPDHAAISETAEAARHLHKKWAVGLINAILRNAQKGKKKHNLEGHSQLLSSPEYQYSHPDWIVSRLTNAWPSHWQSILENNNCAGPLTLRVNRQQGSRSDYAQRLTNHAIAHRLCELSEDGITITDPPTDITSLPGFGSGWVSVQDEAAQLASQFLEVEGARYVLDACAAPGGKSCHLLEISPNLSLTAIDNDPKRLLRINENLTRIQATANVVCTDVCDLSSWWDGRQFDRILIDTPCSGSGVIRRHPDIKWLRREQDLQALTNFQRKILTTLWPCLKPNGVLLYATCSVLPEENSHVVQNFISSQSDAMLAKLTLKQAIESAVASGVDTGFGYQLFPKQAGHDGFFYAKISKQP